ncbi:MAG: TIGR03067 domain-containing protein [Steroidobacteraceae bacterium]
MRVIRIALFSLTCWLAACTTTPATESGGTDALQGTWVVTAGQHEGKSMDVVVGGVLTITGNNFKIHTASGADLQGQLQIDASKRPAEINFVHTSDVLKGTRWLAIYKIEGQTLSLNYVDAVLQEPRPSQFVTSNATEASLLTLRRDGVPK